MFFASNDYHWNLHSIIQNFLETPRVIRPKCIFFTWLAFVGLILDNMWVYGAAQAVHVSFAGDCDDSETRLPAPSPHSRLSAHWPWPQCVASLHWRSEFLKAVSPYSQELWFHEKGLFCRRRRQAPWHATHHIVLFLFRGGFCCSGVLGSHATRHANVSACWPEVDTKCVAGWSGADTNSR